MCRAGNQDPLHKSIVQVWPRAQKRAWELGQTIPGLLGSCSGVGRARARLGRELPAWCTASCCTASSGVAFAPEKVDGAASVPLWEFPGSHCDSSQAFLELGTIGSRLSWDDSPGEGWVEVLLLKIKRPYSLGSGRTAQNISSKVSGGLWRWLRQQCLM